MRGSKNENFDYQLVPDSLIPETPEGSNQYFNPADSSGVPSYMPLSWLDACIEENRYLDPVLWLRATRLGSSRYNRSLDSIPNIHGTNPKVYPSNMQPPGGYKQFGPTANAKGRFVLQMMEDFDWTGKTKNDFYEHYLKTVGLMSL